MAAPSIRRPPGLPFHQRGAALLLIAMIVLLIGLGILFSQSPTSIQTERSNISGDALAQAKAALIGYAATYRDTHPNESYGFLPCPDTNNDGVAEPSCDTQDISVVGRLPWKTLGLAPLRDGNNDCLWYAVSGHAKNDPKTAAYNWDTVGQFIIQDPAGNILAGATPHDQALAVIFSTGSALPGKTRTPTGASECGGSDLAADYLEGLGALGTGNTTVTVANADTIRNATNNDRALWITPREIFDPIKRRSDFKISVETLLQDLANCLNGATQATLATTLLPSATNKGMDNLVAYAIVNCPLFAGASPQKRKFLDHWKNNLLYAAMSAADITNPARKITVNGLTDCKGALIFGGERTAVQNRNSTTDSDNYLESLLGTLPKPQNTAIADATILSAASIYDSNTPANDIATCIKGLPAGATQAAFSTDFGTFTPTGAAAAVTANPDQTVSLQDASGSTGGCFWFGNSIPLAGKTLRAYYSFQFLVADTYALSDPADTFDNGYGFTLQLVAGDMGVPYRCGSESNMGALTGTVTDIWGNPSFIVETDIRRSLIKNDPVENHTAIMLNGNLTHPGALSTTCDGTASSCRHAPANTFEESPTPLLHTQRLEIHTGCNATCSTCTPANHGLPSTTYARITAWVDCTDCSSTVSDIDRTTHVPTIQRCTDLNLTMNSVYLGLTGGFLSGDTNNGVTIRDFVVRSE